MIDNTGEEMIDNTGEEMIYNIVLRGGFGHGAISATITFALF